MILSRSSLPLAGLEVGRETRPRAAGPAGQQGEGSLALARQAADPGFGGFASARRTGAVATRCRSRGYFEGLVSFVPRVMTFIMVSLHGLDTVTPSSIRFAGTADRAVLTRAQRFIRFIVCALFIPLRTDRRPAILRISY